MIIEWVRKKEKFIDYDIFFWEVYLFKKFLFSGNEINNLDFD